MRWKFPPFTSYWVSVVTVAVYFLTLTALVYVHETLPSAPAQGKTLGGIDLDTAWADLETIAQRPHPYNSRENEVVRDYLLWRVQTLADKYPSVEVANDLTSNSTWIYDRHTAFHVEGLNILVKVQGQNLTLPAVLFSAHFDSSATAPGATDDGMGTVTLLSLIEQFAKNPPLRTTLFNLNNGEEDGLCGSQTFFEHPWSKLADIFLNLEGAGSGGRPILFRGSTVRLVETFKKTARPHGTVTSSDAYALGLIKSQTDFEIYVKRGGMKGLDATFYIRRDKYHTMADTVASLGGKAPLWSELQLARDVGRALANLDTQDDSDKAVYWDVLGGRMVVFGLSELSWRLPRVMLLTTLVVVGMMGYLWSKGKAFKPTRAWGYFPLSLLSGIIVSALLTVLYCKINPMIVYSSPYPVLLSIFTSIALSLLFPLRYLKLTNHHSSHALRSLITGQYFLLCTILLFGFYRMVVKLGFTGFYFIEPMYACSSFATITDLGIRVWNVAVLQAESVANTHEAEVTEPLLESPQHEEPNHLKQKHAKLYEELQDATWLPAYIANVLPTLILVCPLALVVCAGLGQTLADGSAPSIVYAGLAVLIFLSLLPLVPFAHQISTRVFMALAIIFTLTTVYYLFAFPFSSDKRVKFFYNQHFDLDTGRNTVQLLGVQPFLQQALQSIPSANNGNSTVMWSTDPIRGLGQVEWEGPTPSLFVSADLSNHATDSLVTSTARRIDENTGVFTVKGKDTKSCTIRFDQNIMDVQVRRTDPAPKMGQKSSTYMSKLPKDTAHSMPSDGVPIVSVYSREWETEFEITVRWNSTSNEKENRSFWKSLFPVRSAKWPTRTGRIGCQWADNHASQIPAVDELLTHLPAWSTITVKKPLLIADRAFAI